MKLSINLASRHHVNRRAANAVFNLLVLLLLVLLAMQVNGYLSDYQLAQTYRAHMEELKARLQGQQPERIDPQAIAQQQEAYVQAQRFLDRDAFRWTELFDRMEALLPKGVSLVSFGPDYTNNSLKISGLARDLKTLQSLLDNLHQSGQFSSVNLNSQGQRELEDQQGIKRGVLTFSLTLKGVF